MTRTIQHEQHAVGNRIKVNAGKHRRKGGVIVKVNPIKHWVVFDDGSLGFVHRSYCAFIEDETTLPSRNQERRTSRPSDPTPHSDRIEVSSVDDSTIVEYGHDSLMTSEVLFHLLARSIAEV
jgi:hypothetical protein